LKRTIFLIIATLLVLGIVLPGCGTTPPPEGDVVYKFTDGKIDIGVVGDAGQATGDMAWAGASVAAATINAMGGVNISGVAHNISLTKIDTDEHTDLSGITGKLALIANVGSCDFFVGGFRTEAVIVYRDVVMDAEKLFFNCGAATEVLQRSVVLDYDGYRYWFKTTPYNEHFLAKSVGKMIGAVAKDLRVALGLSPTAMLKAVIISEDLKWARDEQVPAIKAILPGLNVNWTATYLVSSTDPGPTTNAVGWAVGNWTPDIIIPLYSGTMGAVYAGTLRSYTGANLSNAMSVGINVYAQLKAPWTGSGTNLTSPPPGGPHCYGQVHLDTWADGVNQTSKTAGFLAAMGAALGGEYPLYTAATYDALFILKAAVAAKGYLDGAVGAVNATPLIAYLEDPAYSVEGTVGYGAVYPVAGTTAGGLPALTLAQVQALHNIAGYGYTYNANDWKMPIHTTHDLVYGIGRQTGIGCQWQWTGAAWKKVGVWPNVGANLTDQYGDWGFAYNGTQPIWIPPYVTD